MEQLTSILYFAAVVETGSFSGAAKKYGIARSAVSRRIDLLEKDLNTRLIQRTTRKVSLTEAGERYYVGVSKALTALAEAERELSQLQDEPSGRLVAAIPMSFGLTCIVPLFAGFRSRYPNIKIHLIFDDRQTDLLGEGVDVAIRVANLPSSTMVAKKLGEIRHAVVVSPDYLSRIRTPVVPADVSNYECITYSIGSSSKRWRFKRGEESVDVFIGESISVNNSLAIRDMVLAGMGIALIPIFLISKELSSGKLVELFEGWQLPTLDISALYPSRQHVPAAVKAFIAYLEENISC